MGNLSISNTNYAVQQQNQTGNYKKAAAKKPNSVMNGLKTDTIADTVIIKDLVVITPGKDTTVVETEKQREQRFNELFNKLNIKPKEVIKHDTVFISK